MTRWVLLLLPACTAPDPDKTPESGTLPADSADSADTGGTWISSGEPFDLPPGITNLVLVHVDTFRADRLGLYGHDRETTPLLSARGGRVIRGMQSVAPWTLPSTSSLLTGLEPQHHRLYAPNSSPGDQLDGAIPTMLSGLSAAGWRSYLISGNNWVSDQTLLSRDFDDSFIMGKTWQQNNLKEQVDQVFNWVDAEPDAPFLLMLQPMNMHDPYFSPESVAGTFIAQEDLPFAPNDDHNGQEQSISAAWSADPTGTTEAVRAAYDEQILGVDLAVERIMEKLEARGLLQTTLVVLAGDHGETLGDAGLPVFGHGQLLRPELLDVPLVLFHPQIRAEEFTCAAMNIDTLPTLFTAIGIPPGVPLDQPGLVDGRPLQQGCRDTTRSFLVSGPELAVGFRTDDWQIYHSCGGGVTTIYDRRTDPGGETPIHTGDVPEWPELRTQLLAWINDLDNGPPDLHCGMPPG